MLAGDIVAEEKVFHDRNVQRGHVRESQFHGVGVFDYQHPEATDYFFPAPQTKTLVVLHFTAGFFWGDIDTLTQSHLHVSVAFVVARSGLVYRLFDSNAWSNHLGKEAQVIGGNERNSKRSVAIEISNVGPLQVSGSNLTFAGSRYCKLSETQFYTKLAAPFRGERHFASFTDAQYSALDPLLTAIKTEHAIDRKFMPADKRFLPFESPETAIAHKGVASHVNFRRTGKWDIGPAFDWARIGG